jgi:hypothetical protein
MLICCCTVPQVIIPTYWQRMFRLPPAAAATSTLLVHDP